MSPDPKLIEVARSAEAGLVLPILRLSTAAQLIIGAPGPGSKFNETTWGHIFDEVAQPIRAEERSSQVGGGMAGVARRRDDATLNRRLDAEAAALKRGWEPAAIAPESDPPDSLTLYNALVWAWGEPSGLRVPAVRVRIDAITAWWTGAGELVKGKGSGLGVFAFVSVPIGLGH